MGRTPLRNEWLAAAAILAVAIAARGAFPSRATVEHFDEGVYASNLWFDAADRYQYPLRYLYAPPLLPSLIEWLLIFGGPPQFAPVWPGIVAGCLTVPSLWWVGRSWFGPRAGIAASAIAACSDVHAMLSRTALTDPLLVFFVLWAVFFGERALRGRRGRDLLAAGLLTGLAWWTKYNGWLPLAILAAALPTQYLVERCSGREAVCRAVAWTVVAAIAIAVWSPVWYSLQDQGGYAAVAANHRKYVVGLSGWWPSLVTQWHHLRQCDGWWTIAAGPVLAATLAWRVGSGHDAAPGSRAVVLSRWIALTMLISATMIAASSVVAWLVAVSAVVLLAIRRGWWLRVWRAKWESASQTEWTNSGGAIVAVWLGGLIVATPMYHPYVRLTLPGLAALWLAGGWALEMIWSQLEVVARDTSSPAAPSPGRPLPRWLAIAPAVFAAACILDRGAMLWRGVPAWQARTGLAEATRQLADQATRGGDDKVVPGQPERSSESVFFVYGEPAALYHLRAAGHGLVAPVASLQFAERREATAAQIFLLIGPHAHDDPQFARQWTSTSERFSPVGDAPFVPSPVVRLDRHDALDPDDGSRPPLKLEVFRLK